MGEVVRKRRGIIHLQSHEGRSALNMLLVTASSVRQNKRLFSSRARGACGIQSMPLPWQSCLLPYLLSNSSSTLPAGSPAEIRLLNQKALPWASTTVPAVLLQVSQQYPTLHHVDIPSQERERPEVEKCLRKLSPYQQPTAHNPRCPAKCPVVAGIL